VALADASDPGGTFADDDGTVAEGAIEAIALEGITFGCNPPGNYRYCPLGSVTRGQMAAFLARALALPSSTSDHFIDDNESVYEGAINRLADASITQGCDPPAKTMFCPDRAMTRGEMAAFMARAFDLPPSSTDWFVDDDGTIFEAAINGVAEARITLGCNPPSNTNYCPSDTMNRGQMAIFLARALDLTRLTPPAAIRVPVLHVDNAAHFIVSLDDNFWRVGLIGLDAPVIGESCFYDGTDAMAALVSARSVRIDSDVTGDQIGRPFVNAEMVEAGWASAVDVPPDSRYADLFAMLENRAQTEGLGLWGSDCSADRLTDDCEDSYPDFCIPPPPPDLDCADMATRNFTVVPPDPHGFDENNDNIGCRG
jgi:hypothetical protein